MSFHRIFGYGDTAEEALIYSKINEIGHKTIPTLFLKKTNVKLIENMDKLELNLFMGYNLHRDSTKTELDALTSLEKQFSEKELKDIMDIYRNPECNTVICFREINNFGPFKYMYRFLY